MNEKKEEIIWIHGFYIKRKKKLYKIIDKKKYIYEEKFLLKLSKWLNVENIILRECFRQSKGDFEKREKIPVEHKEKALGYRVLIFFPFFFFCLSLCLKKSEKKSNKRTNRHMWISKNWGLGWLCEYITLISCVCSMHNELDSQKKYFTRLFVHAAYWIRIFTFEGTHKTSSSILFFFFYYYLHFYLFSLLYISSVTWA